MQRLGFETLIASKPRRERDIVLAMVAARIVAPHTRPATIRCWQTTTLAEDFAVEDASEDDLYAAMDWLLQGQSRIEKKLAKDICSPAVLFSMTCRRAILRARPVRWPNAATIAMANADICRSIAASSPIRAAARSPPPAKLRIGRGAGKIDTMANNYATTNIRRPRSALPIIPWFSIPPP
jgi:hypothetical protein